MIFIEGRPRLATNVAWFDRVSTGYFETIGNRIIKGRSFSEQDTAASRHVAVVNESFARSSSREKIRSAGISETLNQGWPVSMR